MANINKKLKDIITTLGGASATPIDTILSDVKGTGFSTATDSLNVISDNISTILGEVDTEISAIKVETDKIPSIVTEISTIVENTDTVESAISTLSNTVALETSVSTVISKVDVVDGLVDAIKAKTDNLPASPCATADVANALVDVKHKDIGATFDASTDSLEAISNKIGVPAVDLNTDIVSINLKQNTLISTIGAVLRKEVTFSNTTDNVNLFTVTGAVKVKIIAVCTTDLASAAGCNIGLKAGTADIIAATASTDILAGELWFNATPTTMVDTQANAVLEYVIGNGGDIVLDIETAKQVDSGAITFYVEWSPISADGAVVAA